MSAIDFYILILARYGSSTKNRTVYFLYFIIYLFLFEETNEPGRFHNDFTNYDLNNIKINMFFFFLIHREYWLKSVYKYYKNQTKLNC